MWTDLKLVDLSHRQFLRICTAYHDKQDHAQSCDLIINTLIVKYRTWSDNDVVYLLRFFEIYSLRYVLSICVRPEVLKKMVYVLCVLMYARM